MIIIDLIGQPCSGKSVLASDLFSKLKKEGYNTKLVSEYATELVYEENFKLLGNQIHVFSEQLKRIKTLENKVDIIVSDTSLLLSLVYSKEKNPFFNDFVLWEYNNLKHLTYYLKNDLPYKKEGRYQDENDAKKIDQQVIKMLSDNNINYTNLKRDKAISKISKDVYDNFKL